MDLRLRALAAAAGLAVLAAWLRGTARAFVAPPAPTRLDAPAASEAGTPSGARAGPGVGLGAAAGTLGLACGLAAAAATAAKGRPAKTAARYTTEKILPAFTWLKAGLKASDIAPTQLVAKTLGGCDVLIGKTEGGKLFCVGNLCPHLGTPMSEGADVIGDVIVCPLHGSSFQVTTGELIDWCPSPPIIGPLTGLVIEKKNLAVIECRTSFFGDDIEVLVDTNAKKAYEADYWKGLLDAQGKVDGTFY